MTHEWKFPCVVEGNYDGDTFKLSIDIGFALRHYVAIRLDGVDTPELRGVVAPLWLRAKCASCGGRGMFDHEVSQAQPVQAREAEEVPRSQLGGIQRRAAPPRRFDGLV